MELPMTPSAELNLLAPAANLETLGKAALPLLDHAEGIYVQDKTGRRLIDGPAGMWCTQIGYNRPEMAKAIADQVLRFSYNSPWNFSNSPAVELASRIAAMTPGDLNRIFFTTGGSTAVDTALRFVEFYNNFRGKPAKKTILARKDGYHGSTSLTAACSGREGNWKNFDIPKEGIVFLSSPNARLFPELTEAELLDHLLRECEETTLARGPETIAAFLAEPVLASGGVIIPPAGYHAAIKALCERYDILYISDEVVTGFGRCGEWFASEKVFGVSPDIITFAKGLTSGYLPLGGLAISDRLIAEISGEKARGAFFTNGYTYSGHPVSCAAALANIRIIEEETLLDHVREIAPYFSKRLRQLEGLPLVADVRATGLVGCVECMTDPDCTTASDLDRKLGATIDAICFREGLIVRPIGNMCVLSPPLIITREQIDQMVGILEHGIRETAELFAAGKLA
jgi:putrescine---pyruvate transaminase